MKNQVIFNEYEKEINISEIGKLQFQEAEDKMLFNSFLNEAIEECKIDYFSLIDIFLVENKKRNQFDKSFKPF